MNILKKIAFDLYERTMAKQAKVIGIKIWEPGNMYEVDIYIPDVDVSRWDQVQHMKCQVAEYIYRDYTPANWNAADRTCTLYIEVGHDGPGSRWARNLQVGDSFSFAVANVGKKPNGSGRFLCLTDSSGLGHYLALRQLSSASNSSDAVVFLHHKYKLPASSLPANIEFLSCDNGEFQDEILEWCWSKRLDTYEFIYMIGQVPKVATLRKALKSSDLLYATKLYSIGFWS